MAAAIAKAARLAAADLVSRVRRGGVAFAASRRVRPDEPLAIPDARDVVASAWVVARCPPPWVEGVPWGEGEDPWGEGGGDAVGGSPGSCPLDVRLELEGLARKEKNEQRC